MSQDVMGTIGVELPCVFCMDERATRIRARLGTLYLDLEARKLPIIPTREELCRGCCRNIQTVRRVAM